MRKIITIVLAVIMLLAVLCSCNKQIIDTTYKFDRAIISLPDGELIRGNVQSWKDYDGDQIQVKIDGTTYLVHSSQIVMIAD